MSEVNKKGKLAKEASYILGGKTTNEKNQALQLIAEQLLKDEAVMSRLGYLLFLSVYNL